MNTTFTKHLLQLLSWLFLLGILLSFAIGLNYLNAWTAPTQAPTGGNVSAPLNTGATLQGKSGGLQMSSLDINGTNGASLVGGQLSFWKNSTIVNPSYTIDMGDLDPGANNGIRFPDDTVQTTAGGGGANALSFDEFMHVQERYNSGVSGPTIAAGAWVKRALNTALTNSISGASLAVGTNQITLPAGTYYAEGDAPIYSAYAVRNALYNVTDATYPLLGVSNWAKGGSSGESAGLSPFDGMFTITSTKVFEFRTRVGEGAYAPDSNFGVQEIYANLKIWKVE